MSTPNFPIVAIGASAGGLEACKQVLAPLPAEPGMALVLVQHLDPEHPSRLVELLGRATKLAVCEARDGAEVLVNHVYVIAPNTNLEIVEGKLRVTPRDEAQRPHLPVDTFLRSLASSAQARAIGVILSGTGSDGTLGLREVKTAGGVTIAQDDASAAHAGMPHSAAQSGCVDFVLPPGEISAHLMQLANRFCVQPIPQRTADDQTHFNKILDEVRLATAVDFTLYRDTTLKRRILRRAMLCGQKTLAQYADMLQRDIGEVHSLYQDLLINVTTFFRDPGVFSSLRSTVLPRLLDSKAPGSLLRVWVPGCSTGEEVYSLAIVLLELLRERGVDHPVQIFATDLGGTAALGKARAGCYPESIEAQVSDELLARYFQKEDHVYRVVRRVRDMCIFAPQNVTCDPPFSRIDLISCRNVLIYMSAPLQQRVLATFHYALNTPGFLVLGGSETIGQLGEQFEVVDRDDRIYDKKPASGRALHGLSPSPVPARLTTNAAPVGATLDEGNASNAVDRALLDRYAPCGVLVDENSDIVEFRGDTSAYLVQPAGMPTRSLAKLAREGLLFDLRRALDEAKSSHLPAVRSNVRAMYPHARKVDIEVLPVSTPGVPRWSYLVMFKEADVAAGGGNAFVSMLRRLSSRLSGMLIPGLSDAAAPSEDDGEPLRRELKATKEFMQSLVEQQDAANEELRSANEEILSTNEELQSMNEELETAKEELQSANEELTTVNEQLHSRNADLAQANNDMTNVLASFGMPLVVVDADLRIRLSTPPATRIMNVLPTDIGRPIGHIRHDIAEPRMEALIMTSMTTAQPLKREVQGGGRAHVLHVYPYRTAENTIDGAILVLVDIEDVKQGELERRRSIRLERADQRKNEFLAMLSHELRNPLAPMATALEIMNFKDVSAAESRRATAVLQRQLAHLTGIVNELLDATRIAEGKIQLHRRKLDIVALVRAVEETNSDSIAAAGLTLSVQLPSEPLYVDGDPLRLTQVLVNLLSNATKFTDRGGHIFLACRRGEHSDDENRVVITVRDTGIGMSDELLPRVFELFTQGDAGSVGRRSGLGVGLALARNLVQLHGGSITAASAGAGNGSTLVVCLPLFPTALAVTMIPVAVPAESAHPNDRPLRILVVEDNDDQAQTLARLLSLWGHDVRIASNGTSALVAAREFEPELALIDLGLPDMDGCDLARQVKSDPRLRNVRLIAHTGWGQEEDRKHTRDAGFDCHLVKPVHADTLRTLLQPGTWAHA